MFALLWLQGISKGKNLSRAASPEAAGSPVQLGAVLCNGIAVPSLSLYSAVSAQGSIECILRRL
jgi:hypothetical protein